MAQRNVCGTLIYRFLYMQISISSWKGLLHSALTLVLVSKNKNDFFSVFSKSHKKDAQEKRTCRMVRGLRNRKAVWDRVQSLGMRKEGSHLSSFGLILYILRGSNLGFDVLKVGQRLVDDADLLGSGCGRFGRGADNGHLPLLGNQTEGAWGPRGPWRWWVARRASWGDGCGARGTGGGAATASWTGPNWFCNWCMNKM